MSALCTKLVITPSAKLSKVCRGCLSDSGEMKNMYEWGLSEDYFRITAIETTQMQGLSKLLCAPCEAAMLSCKQFRERCQLSDKILKTSLKDRARNKVQKLKRNHVTCILTQEQLLLKITAPKMDTTMKLPCPYDCKDGFSKKSDLMYHLKKAHDANEKFKIELQYYCAEIKCAYNINSDKKKYFTGRKFLNQHVNKVHATKTYSCKDCRSCFARESDLYRHNQTCGFEYICQICNTKYKSNDRLMIHLKRKHPSVHQVYKKQKAEKRRLENENQRQEAKKKKDTDSTSTSETVVIEEVVTGKVHETWIFSETALKDGPTTKTQVEDVCDSPKKSFATQIPEDIRNDVTLPSWQSKNEFETKTDEISTQVALEDLLSLKSQTSEDEIFFSDPVSLSDIQTQTFPLEFGLSRCNKETQSCMNSQTQSPDLSSIETQTCFCHQDSPRLNFKLFDSLSSSPASINHTSAETQTGDPRHSVKSDVLLSFSSAETQTCFDNSSNDSM